MEDRKLVADQGGVLEPLGADADDRQLAGLEVDPAREARAALGRDRHRGAGDEAGDTGGRVKGKHGAVAEQNHQVVAEVDRACDAWQCDRRDVRPGDVGHQPCGAQKGKCDRQAERQPTAEHRPAILLPGLEGAAGVAQTLGENVVVRGHRQSIGTLGGLIERTLAL